MGIFYCEKYLPFGVASLPFVVKRISSLAGARIDFLEPDPASPMIPTCGEFLPDDFLESRLWFLPDISTNFTNNVQGWL
jgi:hypothetical protein